MYKYEFVNALASDFDAKSDGFRSIVLDRAKKGWRFVAAVPVYWSENGRPFYIDLVFEKPEDCEQ